MSELFERLADKVAEERAEQTKIDAIKNMMDYFKCSLEEALNAQKLQGKSVRL